MKRATYSVLLSLLLCAAAFAQAPDAVQTSTFSAVGNGTPIFVGGGGPNGAVVWRLTYFVDGASITAAQMAIQGADAANAAGCAAASFSTITTADSSLVEVSNPSASAAQGNVAVKTYYPCIRARVSAITGSGGTVSYQLAGWKFFFQMPQTITPSGTQDVNLIEVAGIAVLTGGVAGSQGIGGLAASGATAAGNPVPAGGTFNTTQPTVTTGQAVQIQASARGTLLVTPGVEGFPVTPAANSAVNLAQVGGTTVLTGGVAGSQGIGGLAATGAAAAGNPVPGGLLDNAGNMIVPTYCDLHTFVNLSGSGNTTLIAASGSKSIYICAWGFSSAQAEDVKLTYGTAANCGSGTTDLTALFKTVQAAVFDPPTSLLAAPASQAVCVNQSLAIATGVDVWYAQR